MGPYDDVLICLHADWKHCQTACSRFADLHNVHWYQPRGAPKVMVHGDVACTDIVAGEIPHECDPMTAPHRLHVCVLKKHTFPKVHAELARLADERRTPSLGYQSIGIRAVTSARQESCDV